MHHATAALAPVPTFLARIEAELSAQFVPSRPVSVGRAPGSLDVMGGIGDYTGALLCASTIDRAAVVATQAREDRELQIFSFDLFDEHRPFTFRMPLAALAACSSATLRRELAEPGRGWAAPIVASLFVLHQRGHANLNDPSLPGL